MFPSGLNFTQVNPLIQQPEKRVKSTDLQALRVLWERSNCPRLNSPSARHLFPSCLLLLTPCIPPSFSPRSESLGWQDRKKKKSPLNSKYFWDSSSVHLWGQRRTKACTWAGSGEWGIKPPLKRWALSSPGRALLIRSAVRWELALISQPARSVSCSSWWRKPFLTQDSVCCPDPPLPSVLRTGTGSEHPCKRRCEIPALGCKSTDQNCVCKWLKGWGSSPESALWISEHWVLERFDIRSKGSSRRGDLPGSDGRALCLQFL